MFCLANFHLLSAFGMNSMMKKIRNVKEEQIESTVSHRQTLNIFSTSSLLWCTAGIIMIHLTKVPGGRNGAWWYSAAFL